MFLTVKNCFVGICLINCDDLIDLGCFLLDRTQTISTCIIIHLNVNLVVALNILRVLPMIEVLRAQFNSTKDVVAELELVTLLYFVLLK